MAPPCDASLRRALLLACAVLAALQQCHAFSSYQYSSVTHSSTKFRITSQQYPVQRTKIGLSAKAADNDQEDRSRPNIIVIKSHDDYVKFLEEDDRLCVIKFYASWCKSCQKFGIKYRHLAFDDGDRIVGIEGTTVHSGEVRFAEVEYSANAKLCKALKVKKLPTVHMHRKGSGKIADMTCKPSLFHLVTDEVHRLMEDDSAGALTLTPDQTELEIDVEKIGIPTAGANVTSAASFDRAMTAGSSLADEIMVSLGKKKANELAGQKKNEKTPWFPFTF
mmetsp:Transcript_6409/g.15963  ORF Transcript_6409/g.15963 Transcript_6409/m.15963 type:complete len:278 (-) Transcript_6409:146-979(-)|eukprot:CAMPEP_0181113282 /NCGR_PEP_ID=MMETSP1071-20121207/20265_1 /TAXON_ID=35127 /ORGANISM="Thalassiosira sp., Strain NH16" /LENGTH=277 /DNA_ID=CAMNT_0023197311 /DNA_START=199 /DNA_END=1032 /DNA_ORIENTATION=+